MMFSHQQARLGFVLSASDCSRRGFDLWLMLATACWFPWLAISEVNAQEPVSKQLSTLQDSGEWQDLFNGRDLTGWVPVNCAAETFQVVDGMIQCSGQPTGVLRTDRHFENFTIELEWRHLDPQGNAGLFVWSDPLPVVGQPFTRSTEIQILDGLNTENYTSHGDVFPIQGATFVPNREHPNGWMRCLPSERRAKQSPEWNHYRVVCQDGQVELSVNGKVVSGGKETNPRRGYICLESEGGRVQFRNVRIQERASSSPPASQIAALSLGYRTLYNGLNLKGWQGTEIRTWQAKDWILSSRANAEQASSEPIWTTQEFGDFELIVDWRWAAAQAVQGQLGGVLLRGSERAIVQIANQEFGSGSLSGFAFDSVLDEEKQKQLKSHKAVDRPIGEWNRFEIRVKNQQVTIRLNGEIVIQDVVLDDLPEFGPIGLLNPNGSLEFANLYVKGLTNDGE